MNTVNAQEIQNFSKDSAHWWDINGPFRPLHRLNPVRLRYLKAQICGHYDLDSAQLKPYTGLNIIDVGCGGGLVCEPMARLGGTVTGLDADENAIHVAKEHAQQSGLEINYLATSSDQHIMSPSSFHCHPRAGGDPDKQDRMPAQGGHDKPLYDVVLALEIIEHVADRDAFVKSIVDLCKPGGLIIFSTLNRTAKSFALGIVAAEYILRWIPQGTHNWKKFVKPSELNRLLENHGATAKDISGLAFNPLASEFHLAPHDTDVNYFISAVKAPIVL